MINFYKLFGNIKNTIFGCRLKFIGLSETGTKAEVKAEVALTNKSELYWTNLYIDGKWYLASEIKDKQHE